MSKNTTSAQHFTELDFDISRIYAQMKEVEELIKAEGVRLQTIINNDWKISDILSASASDMDKGFQSTNVNALLLLFRKLEVIRMVKLYLELIKKSMWTLECVPELWHDTIETKLKNNF